MTDRENPELSPPLSGLTVAYRRKLLPGLHRLRWPALRLFKRTDRTKRSKTAAASPTAFSTPPPAETGDGNHQKLSDDGSTVRPGPMVEATVTFLT